MNQGSINQTDAFYITGGNVPADALSYVTRDADALLLQRLLKGEFCYILTSRQMGKSSLMTQMVKQLRQRNVSPAVLDLSSQGTNLDHRQWYYGLLEQLGRRLRLEDEIEDFCSDHRHLSPLQLWQQALRDVVLAAKPGQVVIFIDEIDVVRSLPFSTDEFFAAIRACYNVRTEDPTFARLNFCLLGVATPTDLISNPKLTPFNIGTRIELGDFSREEARSLEPGLGQTAELNRVLMDRITYWTGGHPYLTQRLCQAVAADDANLTERSVDECAERLFLSAKAQRQDSNLSFVQQRMLPVEEEERIGQLTLYSKVLGGKVVADSDTAAFVSELKLAGIVQVVADQLKVRNRIYSQVFDAAWVQANMPDAEFRRQRAAYYRGMVRAATIACGVLAIVTGFAIWAVHSEMRAVRLNSDLKRALVTTKQERDSATDARGKEAVMRRVAQSEQKNARIQRDNAKRNALQAAKDAKHARQAEANARIQRDNATRYGLRATTDAKRARQAELNARSQRDNAKHLLYIANMNLIQREWDSNNVAHVQDLLEETRTYGSRYFEWNYWNRLCHLSRTLKGQMNGMTSVVFSPDGKRIVMPSDGKTAKVWDAQTSRELLTLKGHTSDVTSVAFSPDGKRIVTGSSDNTAKVWDSQTGRELFTLKGHASYVASVAISLDGKRIVTGSGDKTAKVWDAQTSRELLTLKGHAEVQWVAFSPDAKRVVTLNSNILGPVSSTATVWDTRTGRELFTHADVFLLAFSPDGTRIVSVGMLDKTAKVWDAQTGQELLTLKGHTEYIASVAFSPDSKRIVTGSGDTTANVWDTQTGRELLALKGHTDLVTSVAFFSDGKRIVTGSFDSTVKVWDAETGQELLALKGNADRVNSVAISPDSKRIVTVGVGIKVWDIDAGRELLTLAGHAPVTSVDFAPDGKRIVTGSSSGTAKVWDAEAGRELLTLKGSSHHVTSVAFSPDGKRIATDMWGYDQPIAKVWDAVTGRDLLTLKGHGDHVTSVAFSLDGKRIVTGSDESGMNVDKLTATVWDAQTGRELLAPNGHTGTVFSIAFSPDGKRIAMVCESGRMVKMWDARTGRELQEHTDHVTSSRFHSIAFSPDGKRIITGSSDKTAKVWDTRTGRELLTLKGHTSIVTSVAFSPDGKRIVTGSYDNTAKVWEAETGRELLTLKGHTDHVTSVAFSPDGKRIVTGSYDNTAKVWGSR